MSKLYIIFENKRKYLKKNFFNWANALKKKHKNKYKKKKKKTKIIINSDTTIKFNKKILKKYLRELEYMEVKIFL